MPPTAALACIVLVPVLVLMLLRVNAALVFLSLCLGNVLVQFIAPDTNSFLSLFSNQFHHNVSTGSNTVKLALLLTPAVLTTIFMIRTVRGRGKLAINLLPAAGVGMLAGLLVVPLLPPGLSYNIVNSTYWNQAHRAQALIVGGSAIICLMVLWVQRPKAGHGKHKDK